MKLTIKTANQEFEDLNLECPEDICVKQLKSLLMEEHPAHPSVDDQRLICSGRLLADSAILKDTLSHYGNVTNFIVHLVCKSVLEQKSKLEHNPTKPQEPSSAGTAFVSQVPTFSSYSAPAVPGQNGFYWPNPAMAAYPGISSWDSQHAVWMQTYTAYMSQYYQRLNSSGIPVTPVPLTPIPTPVLAPPVSPPVANVQVQENAHVAQPAPENELRRRPAVAAAPAAENLNRGGGGFEAGMIGAAQVGAGNGEAEPNRDWLDWMYMLTRLGILICFAFLYSSLSRIIGVVLFGCMAYLYQRRARVVQQQRAVTPPPPPPAPEAPPQEEDDNNNSNEPNPDQVNNNIPQGLENNPELQQERNVIDEPPGEIDAPPQLSVVDVVKSALVAFVTSLVPDHQNILN